MSGEGHRVSHRIPVIVCGYRVISSVNLFLINLHYMPACFSFIPLARYIKLGLRESYYSFNYIRNTCGDHSDT